MEDFDVVVSRRGAVAVVTVHGELDVATAPDFERAVEDAAQGADRLVLDLGPATFLDSTGLKMIVRAARRTGDGFALVCPEANHAVQRVIRFAGVDAAYPVHETLAEVDGSGA